MALWPIICLSLATLTAGKTVPHWPEPPLPWGDKVQCQKQAIDNGYFPRTLSGKQLSNPILVTPICNEGYIPVATTVCQADGRWNPVPEMPCVPQWFDTCPEKITSRKWVKYDYDSQKNSDVCMCKDGSFPYGKGCVEYKKGVDQCQTLGFVCSHHEACLENGANNYTCNVVSIEEEHSLRECAGIKFRFSNRISTYSQAVFSCRLSKMILMDLAFTNVHFNGDALECFANILSQTWISEHHYAQFSNAGITRHSAENKGHLFACVPVDYRNKIDGKQLELAFSTAAQDCGGGIVLRAIHDKMSRSFNEATTACQQLGYAIPGPNHVKCMRNFAKGLAHAETLVLKAQYLKQGKDHHVIHIYVKTAWVGWSHGHARAFYGTDLKVHPQDDKLPLTICETRRV
ncbi:uncharacterized protein LOC135824879 [Sycon ciliatum]|uniref:uncharacterized protein LOC135824879 n=1 Tax=Sycon ciliatum TaxID=27933 RepID=UPI0031F6FC41